MWGVYTLGMVIYSVVIWPVYAPEPVVKPTYVYPTPMLMESNSTLLCPTDMCPNGN